MSSLRIVCSTTAANASLISQRSMSLAFMPASLRAFSLTGPGAVSMISGSLPSVATARMRARGLMPRSLMKRSDASATTAAPSTMPLELPAVCTCWMALACG
jgi:hypothetical protein